MCSQSVITLLRYSVKRSTLISKFPSVVKPRFIELVGERTTLPKVDAR
jgi:hypothetical protein